MPELRGTALLATVTTLTSLGFLMIGFDNGLLGGLGMYQHHACSHTTDLMNPLIAKSSPVNGDAFNDTFGKPSQTMIGTIVSIYNSRFLSSLQAGERPCKSR